MRRLRTTMLLGICLLARLELGPSAAEAQGRYSVFALIIGANAGPDKNRPPLRFADDDALQNWQLMLQLATPEDVLTEPDGETRALYPGLRLKPPTRGEVSSAMAALNRRISVLRLKPNFSASFS